MKSLLFSAFLLVASLSYAQVIPLGDVGERMCRFPDNGRGHNVTAKNGERGGVTTFNIDGKYYYSSTDYGNIKRYRKVIREWVGSSPEIINDLTLGYAYNGMPLNITVNAFETSYKYERVDLKDFKVEKWNNGFVSVPKQYVIDHTSNRTPKDKRILVYSFLPQANTLYKISAKVLFRDNRHSSFKDVHMYLCVSDGEGVFTSQRTYTPRLAKEKLCNETKYSVTDRQPGYTYYWSNSSDVTKWKDATELGRRDYFIVDNEDEDDDRRFFVYGKKGSSFTNVAEVDYDVLSRPKTAIFTAGYLQCECELAFTAKPGAGGDHVRWAYMDGHNLKFLNYSDGISNNGKVFNPTPELEAKIKENGEIFLYTYHGFFQRNNEYSEDDYCISQPRSVKFEVAPCQDCNSNFLLKKGSKYVFSAWVKEKDELVKQSYTSPNITLRFDWQGGFKEYSFSPKGNIIDGWQKIEEAFDVPAQTEKMSVILNCLDPATDCYFDDIRLFNFNGSMISYVYDPVTLQLSAKLDNNNMFIKYTYDEEGNLVSTKVETNDGVRSVGETRTNIKQIPQTQQQ